MIERLEQAVLRSGKSGNGKAHGLLLPWQWWESIGLRLWPLEVVGPNQTVAVRRARHGGPEVRLRDGRVVRKGDPLLEVHLHSRRLGEIAATDPVRGRWQTLRLVQADLEWLRREVEAGRFGEVRALHGVTLYGLVARWSGFESRPLPHSLRWRLVRFFMRGLARIYEPRVEDGPREVHSGPWPFEVWASVRARGDASGEKAVQA